jgi:hypothetical protein
LGWERGGGGKGKEQKEKSAEAAAGDGVVHEFKDGVWWWAGLLMGGKFYEVKELTTYLVLDASD